MSDFRIDFLISNDSHHVGTFNPVIHHLRPLLGNQCTLRLISLCELRGIATPSSPDWANGEPVIRLFPSNIRKSTSAGTQSGSLKKVARRFARLLVSRFFLKQKIEEWLYDAPHLVVLPNDAAFPYDLICSMLRARSISFVLVQEGIRFPLPVENGRVEYGSGGAARIAAWGKASAEYFIKAGANENALRLTGCPRFDQIADTDWSEIASDLRERLATRERIITFLTNPIDDQGFCSTAEKLDLVASFARGIAGTLEIEGCTLLVKPHARESANDYRSAFAGLPLGESIRVVEGIPLYPLLAASSVAVTLASTAGLEALLFDLPLGILKLPAVGYVHDYVNRGVAWGLESNGPVSSQIREMLHAPDQKRSAVDAYLNWQISRRTGSAESVAVMIGEAIT